MVKHTIQPEQYRERIEARLRALGLHPSELLIAESVHDWAISKGVVERNPGRIAMALRRSDGYATIVLVSHITPEMQQGVKDAMWAYGFPDERTELIDSSDTFLEHLVLHEAAHLLLDDASEAECDSWAFDHLTGF